jgi:serine/threonine protein kinase
MIGDVLDHYRVLELVGRGAMGVVYKALDLNLDRPVAIKVMSAESRNDPDFVERFRKRACKPPSITRTSRCCSTTSCTTAHPSP